MEVQVLSVLTQAGKSSSNSLELRTEYEQSFLHASYYLSFYPSDTTLSSNFSMLQVCSSIGKRNWTCWAVLQRFL